MPRFLPKKLPAFFSNFCLIVSTATTFTTAVFSPFSTHAQEPGLRWKQHSMGLHPLEKTLNTTYVREDATYEIPFSLTESEAWLATAALGATLIAFTSEKDMLEFVQRNNGRVADRVSNVVEHIGGPGMGKALLAGLVYAVVADDRESARFFRLAFKSGALTYLANSAIKRATRRPLPEDSNRPFSKAESTKTSRMAFPSSHAAAAFSLATIISETYGNESRYIPIFAYGTAALTAWSRVYDNKHWVSDVIAGAFLGHIIAKNVVRAEDTKSGFILTPYVAPRTIGFQVTYAERFERTPKECIRAEPSSRVESCIAAHLQGRR